MGEAAKVILLYFVLPAWIVVGLADWFCHRASRIHETAGPAESVFHLVGLGEMGSTVLCGLFLEINALVIGLMFVCYIAHAITLWLDVRYATNTREVIPIEQTVHNYMEALPLLGLGLVVLLHWPQFLALLTLDTEVGRYSLELKRQPLPLGYTLPLLMAALILNVLPFLEELLRGLRARRGRSY